MTCNLDRWTFSKELDPRIAERIRQSTDPWCLVVGEAMRPMARARERRWVAQ